jgi:hypothetical protein
VRGGVGGSHHTELNLELDDLREQRPGTILNVAFFRGDVFANRFDECHFAVCFRWMPQQLNELL